MKLWHIISICGTMDQHNTVQHKADAWSPSTTYSVKSLTFNSNGYHEKKFHNFKMAIFKKCNLLYSYLFSYFF